MPPPEEHHAQSWYLAYTKPRQEEIAHLNLEQQGFQSYLPRYKKLKASAQGLVCVFEPLFPRYIFFKLGHLAQSISTVRSTRGIASIVRFGFEPAVIGEELLHRIRQLEEERKHATVQELSNLKAGQTVRLKHTGLGEVDGLIQSVSSKRVAVLLHILGRPTVVQLEHHQVQRKGR